MLKGLAAKQITAVASTFGELFGLEAATLPLETRRQLALMMQRAIVSTVESEDTDLARIVGSNLYPKVAKWLVVK